MGKENKIKKQPIEEIEELRLRLIEAEETLSAIRSGEVDAIVVPGLQGEQVFTLTGAERAYRVLIETMNEGAASLNQEGIIIYCNQRLSEMLKTPLEKVIGAPMRQFILASDLPVFDRLIERGAQENGKGEVAFIKNDGTVLPGLLSISALQKDNANICGLTVTDLTAQKHIEDELKRYRDHLEELVKVRTNELKISNKQLREEITERKRTEEELLRSQHNLNEAQRIAHIGSHEYDVRNNILYWSDEVYNIFGISKAECVLTVDDFFKRIHPDDRERVQKTIEQAIAATRQGEFEHRIIRPDGTERIVIEKFEAIFEHGQDIRHIGTIQDITEHKRADDALRESEERFRQIAESTEEWIWEVNNDGLYTYASHVVEKILGYKPEEIVGEKHFYDFFPSDKREEMKKEAFDFFATKRMLVKYVNSNVHKNGSKILIETSGAPILDSRGDLLGYRGVDVDITSYRKLEDQLRHAQKMEAVGTLAGGIAHDFNNILNVIMGYGGMVNDSLEAGSPLKEQMNEVLTAADRAVTLTKRLLSFSRKQVVEVKPVNINELILGLQKMLLRTIRENIDFKLDLADKPLVVMADAGQIEQVLMNFTTNARDAMPEGGHLTIGTRIQELDDEYVAAYGYGKPGMYALITVTDTGHGMDEETKKKIFEPFFTTKGIGEGTGLGLAISYGIIKQHNGYIKVYSEPGQGAEFKIYLPLIEETALLNKKIEASVPAKGGNEMILVAEDDASLRKLSKIVLEAYGYSIVRAEDGEDAITKFMENRDKIQLVILDMIMPKKSGKEAGEAIRKESPLTKILFMSGYTMDIIKTRELTEAGFDFILKPVVPKDLVRKVREVLDR
jgi:PAS domain S-box-containing protein